MCQYLKDLLNSIKQYISNDQHLNGVTKSYMIESLFKVQIRPMDFNETKYRNSVREVQIPHCNHSLRNNMY